jgi:hypothetical protein
MEEFIDIRTKIHKRYEGFKPTFCFINTEYGTQMLVRLIKHQIEILVNIDETYHQIKVKLDSLIVLSKNRNNKNFCQCGYNFGRFIDYTKCKICGQESCVCCHFISFKMNKGEIVCYKCNNRTQKKIRPQPAFERIFNKTLLDYVEESNNKELLEIVKII